MLRILIEMELHCHLLWLYSTLWIDLCSWT